MTFGPTTVIEGTRTRGALASISVRVISNPMEAARYPSGVGVKEGLSLRETIFAVRLERQRHNGLWLITDLIDNNAVGSNRGL